GGEPRAPREIARGLLYAWPLGLGAMKQRALRSRVPGALGALEPLGKLAHRRVMNGHGRVEPLDLITHLSQSDTQLGFFPCDQTFAIAPYLKERGDPHHRVAATSLRVSDRGIPLQ